MASLSRSLVHRHVRFTSISVERPCWHPSPAMAFSGPQCILQGSCRPSEPLLPTSHVPKNCIPIHHRVLAPCRIDGKDVTSFIRPQVSRVLEHPLPLPDRSHRLFSTPSPSASALPKPVFDHSRRSQPYPSERLAPAVHPISTAVSFSQPPPHSRALRPPKAAAHPPGSHPTVLQAEKDNQARKNAFLCWKALLTLVLPHSLTLQNIHNSTHFELLEQKLLSRFAETTILRYCAQCLAFFTAAQDLGKSISALSLSDRFCGCYAIVAFVSFGR